MVIAIIAVIISILLPALGKAKQAGQTVKCMSNMRQITQALLQFREFRVRLRQRLRDGLDDLLHRDLSRLQRLARPLLLERQRLLRQRDERLVVP